MHGLSRCDNALSDRMGRASSSSFPESSAARFCDFSSHFMALATHMSLSLASHSTTACNSVFTESLLLTNLSAEFFDQGLSCSLCCTCCHRSPHALSHASGKSRPHSTQTSPPSPSSPFAFSVTACAVSDSTVIVVTEVSASSTTFRLRRV